ncbi:MAG TPA: FmdB family zinc ribbon protein [Candidatus Dormibacteraeota bacterium]
MPTYGYRCGSCGHEFEVQQRITDEPFVTCPKCGGKLSKMLYPAGIIFKGSGYYTTDYKGSGNGSAGSSNGVAPASTSEGSSESKPETKSESKSETKTESKSEPKSESKSKSKSESKSSSTDTKGS